jgi:phosphinothricin acetyltransferase
MSFSLRAATKHDLPAILAIYNHEIEHNTANWNTHTVSIDYMQNFFAELQTHHFPLIVAVDDLSQQIAAYADYSFFSKNSGYMYTVEHSVFVKPEYQGHGLGKRLMHALIEHAHTQDMHMMVAAIDAENQGSIQLHQKLGFVQTGYLPQMGFKFGTWRDLVYMQLNLEIARGH